MSEIEARHERTFVAPQPFRFTLRGLLRFVVLCAVLCAIAFRVIYPLIEQSRAAAQRQSCERNLAQIGMTLQTYHDIYKCYPAPFVADSSGKPMHSWRASILPLMMQSSFGMDYDDNRPWDSPENRAVVDAFPFADVYECPHARNAKGKGFTNYVMIVGPETFAQPGRWMKHDEIADGSSRTIMIVEIANSNIFWAEPRDLTWEELSFKINDRSRPSISSGHIGGAMVLFADGHIKFLDDSTEPGELKALLTAAAED